MYGMSLWELFKYVVKSWFTPSMWKKDLSFKRKAKGDVEPTADVEPGLENAPLGSSGSALPQRAIFSSCATQCLPQMSDNHNISSLEKSCSRRPFRVRSVRCPVASVCLNCAPISSTSAGFPSKLSSYTRCPTKQVR